MAMTVVYALVVIGSAFLAGWMGARTLARLGKQIGFSAEYAQAAITIAMIGFLTVVSMPAGVLIAAIVGALASWAGRYAWLAMLAMVALATAGVWESPGSWPEEIPEIGFLLLAAVIVAASLFAARGAQLTLPVLGGVAAASCMPLLIAPLVFAPVHSSLALDAAIILAALAGGVWVLPRGAAAAPLLRLPLAVLVAYGAIQAMHYGAWPLGIVSLLIWLTGVKLAPRAVQAVI
jgi:hypothetical protein